MYAFTAPLSLKGVRNMGNFLRITLRRVKNAIRSTERGARSLKWRYFSSKGASEIEIRSHLMVVKNSEYVELARICIESFLYHHPKGTVTIHCDSVTVTDLRKFAGRKWTKNRIQVFEDFDYSTPVWQDQKLKLMLGLVGTNDFFIDADMRWNAPGKFDNQITFFVQEFKLKNRAPYREIVTKSSLSRFENSTMNNVSYFSFGGKSVSSELLKNVWKIKEEWLEVVSSDLIGEDDRNGLVRLQEQVALSMASQEWSLPIHFMKQSDGHRDGAFLESSYFGATGSKF
jgi:hypothetical protein